MLIAYNLVRRELERTATAAGVPPARISFLAVYRFLSDEWLWCGLAGPGATPKRLRVLRGKVQHLVLPERRHDRSYPRAVKVKVSPYSRKHSARAIPRRKRRSHVE